MQASLRVGLAGLVGVGVIVLMATGCTGLAPSGIFVEMPSGTIFTTSRTDTGSFGSGSAEVKWSKEDRIWEGQRVAAFVSADATFLDDGAGGFLAVQSPDGRTFFKFAPAVNLAWPLAVGKEWTSRHTLILVAEGVSVPLAATWKVESFESLKTRAGTFGVFKVHYTDDIGNDNIEYVNTQLGLHIRREWRRTEKHPLGPGTRTIELVSISRK